MRVYQDSMSQLDIYNILESHNLTAAFRHNNSKETTHQSNICNKATRLNRIYTPKTLDRDITPYRQNIKQFLPTHNQTKRKICVHHHIGNLIIHYYTIITLHNT